MRNILIIIGVIIVAVAGYYWYSGGESGMETGSGEEISAPESGSMDGGGMAEDASKAADEAANVVTDTADKVEEGASNMAGEAVDAVSGAATAMDEATTGGAEDTGAATENGAMSADTGGTATDTNATEPADTTQATTPASDAMTPEQLLTPENFDADKIVALIDGSDLPDAQKTVLRTAVQNAAGNPELVSAAITQVKQALNL